MSDTTLCLHYVTAIRYGTPTQLPGGTYVLNVTIEQSLPAYTPDKPAAIIASDTTLTLFGNRKEDLEANWVIAE